MTVEEYIQKKYPWSSMEELFDMTILDDGVCVVLRKLEDRCGVWSRDEVYIVKKDGDKYIDHNVTNSNQDLFVLDVEVKDKKVWMNILGKGYKVPLDNLK